MTDITAAQEEALALLATRWQKHRVNKINVMADVVRVAELRLQAEVDACELLMVEMIADKIPILRIAKAMGMSGTAGLYALKKKHQEFIDAQMTMVPESIYSWSWARWASYTDPRPHSETYGEDLRIPEQAAHRWMLTDGTGDVFDVRTLANGHITVYGDAFMSPATMGERGLPHVIELERAIEWVQANPQPTEPGGF
jgi:hypothetical protein